MAEKLFPDLPKDLGELDEQALKDLLQEHKDASALINENDEDFLKGLSAPEINAEYERGVEQAEKIVEAVLAREQEVKNFEESLASNAGKLEEALAKLTPITEETVEPVASAEDEPAPDDPSEPPEEEVTEEKVEEKELVLASADATSGNSTSDVRVMRRPPAPSADRTPQPTQEPQKGAALVASAQWRPDFQEPLDPDSLAKLSRSACLDLGPLAHTEERGRYRTPVHTGDVQHFSDGRVVRTGRDVDVIWDGPKTKIARAEFDFPAERTLSGGDDDVEKIRAVMPANVQIFGKSGGHGGEALVASGGLCAPLTPIYTMPNFATDAEPVWDSLPAFRAARGGVNVPTATYIADITTAISSISEADDALGGTFATKSCQDLTCPEYTETAVQIFAHCREYGNLNARAWPEKIAHENALTMAALSQTGENFMLERIKALSVNVTNGAETLGALIYLVDAITKAMWGIRGRLRMSRESRFRVLLPVVIEDIMKLDTISTQFDRYRSPEAFVAYLRSIGVDPVFYIDGNFAAGDDQVPDAAQTAGALDGFPNTIQWAIYPEGAFIGIDSGVLELGIVRDSVLNSTNDFQVFGERFRNLALLAPQQAAYWVTTDLCPTGQFPPDGTVRTCE